MQRLEAIDIKMLISQKFDVGSTWKLGIDQSEYKEIVFEVRFDPTTTPTELPHVGFAENKA